MSLRVLLADDHSVVLGGLRALLSLEDGLEVVGACIDGIEVLEAVDRDVPEVLVMDAEMPRCGGIEAHRRLREAGVAIPTVILSAALDDHDVLKCLTTGVNGIVLKESAASVLVEAIRAVAAGDRWVSEELASRALALEQRRDEEQELTPREREVVTAVARGGSNKRVATALGISESTVKVHLHHAFSKLGVRNRVQLSLMAREKGWV